MNKQTIHTDRIHLEYAITFATPFHCGTGMRAGLIDRTVIRDRAGYLYVPGSTIKGVLRSYCEQLACLFTDDADKKMLERIGNPHDEKSALWELGKLEPATMITRIFGSHSHRGLLFFEDARQSESDKRQYDDHASDKEAASGKYLVQYPETDRRERKNLTQPPMPSETGHATRTMPKTASDFALGLQTDIYTQVRLDRPTRTSIQGALYTSEFGNKVISLQGSISGWLSCWKIDPATAEPTYSFLLLLAGLHMIEHLGGNKSTGKGQCRCVVTRLLRNGIEETDWQAWFNQLEALSLYSSLATDEEVEV